MSAAYDYVTFELARGREAWSAFAAYVRDTGANILAADGSELVGLFAPQLGFASNEAIVLLRHPSGARALPDALVHAPGVVARHLDRLSPTLRPRDGQRLRSGGIYVHRWFTADGDRASDFIDLSNRAWGDFEGAYETEIFGLFAADKDEVDRKAGAARFLLLTWYASHGVWEASREQSRDAKSLFAQRHVLTRSTVGRSSLLLA